MEYQRLHMGHKIEFQDYETVQKTSLWAPSPANDEGSRTTTDAFSALKNANAAKNFHDVLVGKGDAVLAATGAFLLYQHLIASGFEADLMAQDDHSTVTAWTNAVGDEPDLLLAQVEELLADMVAIIKQLRSASFTVGGVRSVVDQGRYHIEVHLIS